MDRVDLCSPYNSDHDVDILFLEFVAVDAIGIPGCPEDADAGSNDSNHRRDRMERDLEPFLQFGHQFCNSYGWGLYKEHEDFAPDAGFVP